MKMIPSCRWSSHHDAGNVYFFRQLKEDQVLPSIIQRPTLFFSPGGGSGGGGGGGGSFVGGGATSVGEGSWAGMARPTSMSPSAASRAASASSALSTLGPAVDGILLTEVFSLHT